MAYLIILIGLLATVAYRIYVPDKADGAYVEFASNIVNILSIGWIMFVLWRNERKSDDVFGKAIRKEISTVLLMILLAATYSILTLMKSL